MGKGDRSGGSAARPASERARATRPHLEKTQEEQDAEVRTAISSARAVRGGPAIGARSWSDTIVLWWSMLATPLS